METAKTTDPVTTEIIRNALIAAAGEMNANLIRSAYSPVIYEMKDCSVGIFDRDANLLGQAAGLPIFLGNLEETIRLTTDKFGIENYREGDVYLLNDSYLTGTHLGDLTVISPIFHQGDLVGFTASRAHWLDVGAKDPAFPIDTTEIYQEGLRLPPTRIYAEGTPQRDLLDILRLNIRTPIIMEGDLNAQIAAARTGERRYQTILDRFGRDTVEASAAEIFAQTAALDRDAVATIPDGIYRAEGFLDNDGHGNDPVHVRIAITIDGDDMTMDLSGSSPQVGGNTNCGRAQSVSGCRVAYKMLINPDVAVNGGTFAPLDVIIPEGSIFAATNPAACQFYFTPLGLLIDLVSKALGPVLPDRTAAAHFGDSMVSALTIPGAEFQIHPQANPGGWGASAEDDGESALINNVNGGLKSIPVEVSESIFPVFIHEYSLRTDSGGAGKHRGGLGIVKEYEALEANTHLTTWHDRSKMPAWGLNGGCDGKPPVVYYTTPDGKKTPCLKMNFEAIPVGTRLRVETGGGGGFGPPDERSTELIERDLREGYITEAEARRSYDLGSDLITR